MERSCRNPGMSGLKSGCIKSYKGYTEKPPEHGCPSTAFTWRSFLIYLMAQFGILWGCRFPRFARNLFAFPKFRFNADLETPNYYSLRLSQIRRQVSPFPPFTNGHIPDERSGHFVLLGHHVDTALHGRASRQLYRGQLRLHLPVQRARHNGGPSDTHPDREIIRTSRRARPFTRGGTHPTP